MTSILYKSPPEVPGLKAFLKEINMSKAGRSMLRGAKEALAFARKHKICPDCKEVSPVVEGPPGAYEVRWVCECIKTRERKPS